MTTEITASLVVDFRAPDETGPDGTAPDAVLSIEVDSRDDGLNAGKSVIRPGDDVYFLVKKTDNVTINDITTTAGAITPSGGGLISIGAPGDPLYLNFIDNDEATLSDPIAGGLSTSWLGADGGNVAQASQVRLRTQQKVVGVLQVSYSTQYQAYRLSNVPASIPRVIIFARGTYG